MQLVASELLANAHKLAQGRCCWSSSPGAVRRRRSGQGCLRQVGKDGVGLACSAESMRRLLRICAGYMSCWICWPTMPAHCVGDPVAHVHRRVVPLVSFLDVFREGADQAQVGDRVVGILNRRVSSGGSPRSRTRAVRPRADRHRPQAAPSAWPGWGDLPALRTPAQPDAPRLLRRVRPEETAGADHVAPDVLTAVRAVLTALPRAASWSTSAPWRLPSTLVRGPGESRPHVLLGVERGVRPVRGRTRRLHVQQVVEVADVAAG